MSDPWGAIRLVPEAGMDPSQWPDHVAGLSGEDAATFLSIAAIVPGELPPKHAMKQAFALLRIGREMQNPAVADLALRAVVARLEHLVSLARRNGDPLGMKHLPRSAATLISGATSLYQQSAIKTSVHGAIPSNLWMAAIQSDDGQKRLGRLVLALADNSTDPALALVATAMYFAAKGRVGHLAPGAPIRSIELASRGLTLLTSRPGTCRKDLVSSLLAMHGDSTRDDANRMVDGILPPLGMTVEEFFDAAASQHNTSNASARTVLRRLADHVSDLCLAGKADIRKIRSRHPVMVVTRQTIRMRDQLAGIRMASSQRQRARHTKECI